MRVRGVNFEGSAFGGRLQLSGSIEEATDNWTTVLVGPNGCGKSLLLRVLAEGGLGQRKFRGFGHGPLKFSFDLDGMRPKKVIAVSATPLDRFPRGGGRDVISRRRETLYDRSPYLYLGQRSVNGMVGAMESERSLARLYLKHFSKLNAREGSLERVFGFLGLSPELGYRLRKPLRDGLRVQSQRSSKKIDVAGDKVSYALG